MKAKYKNFDFFSGTSDDDIEYFVRECGHILGVTQNLPAGSRDARHVLDYIFNQLVEFKNLEVFFPFFSFILFSPPPPFLTKFTLRRKLIFIRWLYVALLRFRKGVCII